MKTALLDHELVREVAVHPGGCGERFLLLELTEAGRDLLASYGVTVAAGHGRGGLAHQWWTRRIADWLHVRGVSAVVEDDSQGARIDLSFEAAGKLVAVEVEMGEGHAAENIRKDLEVGYSPVITLFDDPGAIDRLRKRLSAELGETLAAVRLSDLRDYEAVLAPLLGASAPLRGPNQDEERRARRRGPVPREAPPPREPMPSALLGEPGALTTPAAAEYLGLSPATLETMRTRGGGPVFVKLGRRVVYRREDLDRWLEERRRTSTSDPGLGAP